MKVDYSKAAKKWLENSTKFQLDGLALQGIRIDRVEIGVVRCNFVIPDHLSDENGNWNVGAISVLIDDMAAGAVFSYCGGNLATVDFTMSFYSMAKVNEEVEIEANVVGEKGNLVSVVIDIKKKANGEKVVVGKQWMHLPSASERKGRRKNDKMEVDYPKAARKWLENSSELQLDGLALQGIRVDRVERGVVRCDFVIPDHLSDENGNWNVGAMSVLIDDMAAGAVFSYCGGNLATVDFTMSFYSTAKEELQIEANVVGEKGNLVSVVIDIKKKSNGEKVVIGKQWMHVIPFKKPQAGKSKL
ncbi:hypothetical protein LXL04_032132 [Taraxacum kok-saghyz]